MMANEDKSPGRMYYFTMASPSGHKSHRPLRKHSIKLICNRWYASKAPQNLCINFSNCFPFLPTIDVTSLLAPLVRVS